VKNYTIDCTYYNKSFNTIEELITDITISGMSPNFEILFNGQRTGEEVIDLMTF
tara:strand:+ start:174 stop:335 length:162 start_codon:yes stop_codon:yes gene_type:complete